MKIAKKKNRLANHIYPPQWTVLAVSTGILVMAVTLLGYVTCTLLKKCLVVNAVMKEQKCKHFWISFKNLERKKRVRSSTTSIYNVLVFGHHETNDNDVKNVCLTVQVYLNCVPMGSSNILKLWNTDLEKYRIYFNFLICFSIKCLNS